MKVIMGSTKPRGRKTISTEDLLDAQAYVGRRAVLTQGLVRGPVVVKAVRPVFGRVECLVENDEGSHRWINLHSKLLEWQPQAKNNGEKV